MDHSSFEDFCTGLCALLGCAPPPLKPDDIGTVAFTLDTGDGPVGFVSVPGPQQAPALLMLVSFGVPRHDIELQACRAVLEMNFAMAGIGMPSFARHPDTGMISLHYAFLLSQVDAATILRQLDGLRSTIASWRADYAQPSGAPVHAPSSAPAARLRHDTPGKLA